MTDFSDIEKKNLKNFFSACNEMINGRFILSDIKIAKILNSIANSSVLYDLFAKCMVDFNYKVEFRNAKVTNKVNGGYFVLPNDEKKIVALVFCFLIDVDNSRINLQSFINENFYAADGYNISYSNFAINVLVPFKNSVSNLLGVNESGEDIGSFDDEDGPEQLTMDGFENEDDDDEEPVSQKPTRQGTINLMYADFLRALNQLYSAVKKHPKMKEDLRSELIIIIKAIKEAVTIEKLIFLNALIIPLEHTISKDKYLRSYYNDLKTCLMHFYD
jgi:hypothetical protein